MKRHPISKDPRYTIDKEFCGYAEKRFVLRFCGEFILSSQFYSTVAIRAVGHNSERIGSPVITEKLS